MTDILHLRRLLKHIEHELSSKPMKPFALHKVKRYLKGLETPKPEMLDKLSLFVGFQDWKSFKETLNGESDGLEIFEQPLSKKKNKTAASASSNPDNHSS